MGVQHGSDGRVSDRLRGKRRERLALRPGVMVTNPLDLAPLDRLGSSIDFLKVDTTVDFDLLEAAPAHMVSQMQMGPIKDEEGMVGEDFTLSASLMNISLDKDIVDEIGLTLPSHYDKVRRLTEFLA